MTSNLLATLLFCTLVGGSALAQSPERNDAPRRGPGAGGATAFMRMIPVMAALDANQDGRISSDEIENASAALRKLDKNKDGQLTIDELRPRGGVGIVGRRGAEGQRGRPATPNAAFVAETLKKHDANKDGKLSGEEIPDQFARRIERIDLDGDKAISKAELEEMMSRAGYPRQRGGDQGERPAGDRPRQPQGNDSGT